MDVGEFGGWTGAVKPAFETGVDVTGWGVFRLVLSPATSKYELYKFSVFFQNHFSNMI